MQAGLRHEEPRTAPPAGGGQVSRRCIVSGDVHPRAELLRFVVGPDNRLTPDLAERLPGRGIWVTADRQSIETAISRKLFDKAARQSLRVDAALVDSIEQLLVQRCVDLIGLARRAGQAISGFEKAGSRLRRGASGLLLAAADGAADGRGKLRRLAPDLPIVESLLGCELGRAFGRDHVVHATMAPGALANKLRIEAGRLDGFRRDDRNEDKYDRTK